MPTCVNCDTDAKFAYTAVGEPIYYCEPHLPRFTQSAEYQGSVQPVLPTVEPTVEAPVEEAPKPSKKANSKATAEETTAPAEEPTP